MEPEHEVVTWSSYLGFHSSDGKAALEGYKPPKYLSTVQELVNLFGFLLWRMWQENNKKS